MTETAMTEAAEFFQLRGLGLEWDLPCFVTGSDSSRAGLKPNISGFVQSREAGERIVAMFGGNAKLDYRTSEPNWIQVKIGVLPAYIEVLKRLEDAIIRDNNQISPQVIQQVKVAHGLIPAPVARPKP